MSTNKVCLLLTGSELMNGDVIDTNSILIAKEFSEIGLSVTKKVTIGDNIASLIDEISTLSIQQDILLINGGLGPTEDDLTAQALARSCSVELNLNSEAHQHLIHWAKQRNTTLNTPNMKQAYLPKGCNIIANDLGSAVGFSMVLNNCFILCTPGVPKELDHMLRNEIRPNLLTMFPQEQSKDILRIQTFGLGESYVQELINTQLPNWPNEIEIGYRATMPILEIKLISSGYETEKTIRIWLDKLKLILGDHIVSVGQHDPNVISKQVTALLQQKQLTITTAESCTGGLIASDITKISGSSIVFEAGYVTYSNRMKNKMLSVPENTLTTFGAVSEQTVLAMANGALYEADADMVIAVSGIAGPNGGTPDKPVGSVWIAWGSKNEMQAKYFLINGDRQHFQQIVAARGLDLIRRMLINSKETPRYCETSTHYESKSS